MNFHNFSLRRSDGPGGFTLVEVMIGIAVLGVGAAVTIGALTKFNSLAATSRNASGAYATVVNQIDLFESISPFNPQKLFERPDCDNVVHAQIPKDYTSICAGQLPAYDMTATAPNTWRPISVDGTTYNVPVYQYKDPTTGNVIVVNGLLEIQVNDLSATLPNTYQAIVRVSWQYLGRGPIWNAARNRWEYQFTMSTIRTSDI